MILKYDSEFELFKIKWERVFLNFDVKGKYKEKISFYFIQLKREIVNLKQVKKFKEQPIYNTYIIKKIPIVYNKYCDGAYKFSINISAVKDNAFLDNGQWMIGVYLNGEMNVINVDYDLAYKLDDYSRIFRYGRGKYAYNVSFNLVDFVDDRLVLCLHSYFVKQNNSWKKRKYIQEAFTLKGKIGGFYKYIVIKLIRCFYYSISMIIPQRGKNVLFMSETKDYLWGNLKYIHDRLYSRKLDKQFNISVSCRKSVGEHASIMSWIKTVFLISKQDYIFIDDYAPIFGFFKLNDTTKLIQVWHAGEGFKSVGYSRFGKNGSPFPSESCHKAYNYVLTGSEKLIKVYEEVFGLDRKAFLPVGMARLDDFLDSDKIERFKSDFYNKHKYLENKKIILFAPTFRGTGQIDAYYDYDKLDLGRIYDFCGEEYVFMIKMHPFVHTNIQIPEKYKKRIIDFSSYPNINDLYYVTDILITDYSSNYYEFALLKKPVLFYTYDRKFYELKRGVHRDVKSHAPGKVCDTFDDLMSALENKDYEIEKIYQFVDDNFKNYDGHASDRVIDQILLKKENDYE